MSLPEPGVIAVGTIGIICIGLSLYFWRWEYKVQRGLQSKYRGVPGSYYHYGRTGRRRIDL